MSRIFLILAFIGVVFVGCDKDKEHTSLLGSWNCEETPEQTLPRIYQVSILRNAYLPNANNEYKISNFYKWGLSESAEVYFYQDTITGQLIIPDQIIPLNGASVSGTGTVAEDFSQIIWEYRISTRVLTENVKAAYY